LAAAALVSEYRGIVQYIYGGVEEELYSLSPLKSLLDHVRRWSRSRGDSVLHLGGGRGAREDSLFYFKAGFSGRRHPFYTGRWILNQELYRRLSEERRTQGRELKKNLDGNFFPAYRAPFVEPVEENVPLLSAVID
jgi:lipid II:glycine glycyltransferase (peptidoglycan interpeptide bridge formation enzyme)